MLSFRRLSPTFKCLFSISPITSSVPRRAEFSSSASFNAEREGNIQDMLTVRESVRGPASYKQFLEDIGDRYKFSSPQNWLGGEVPFPMNPSFKPPPPISDKQRETIYRMYSLNPKLYNIRKISKIFNISLKRVTAILRLKNLEKHWIKEGKQLQTGFLDGMERLLKAQTHNAIKTLDVHPLRSDVYKADLNEQKEQRDLVNIDLEQLYWESIPEDSKEPILPHSLQEAEKTAIAKKKRREAKENAKFMHRIPDTEFIKTPTYKVLTLPRNSRPTTRFVDVGSAFMNARDLALRKVASRHTSRIRAQRAMRRKKTAAMDYLTPTTRFVDVDSEDITTFSKEQVDRSKKYKKKKERKRRRLVLRRQRST